MRYVVGLGNPGPKYVDTRHNFGFLCLEELSRHYRECPRWSLVEESTKPGVARWEQWHCSSPEAKVMLVWPLTFMNLSGQSLEFLSRRSALPSQDQILVVVDDLSLPLGQLRLRKKGSSGGHNGLKSIEGFLGSGDYPRLRLGIGSPLAHQEVIDFVLSPFETNEQDAVKAVTLFASCALAEWSEGVSFDGLVGKVNGWHRQA